MDLLERVEQSIAMGEIDYYDFEVLKFPIRLNDELISIDENFEPIARYITLEGVKDLRVTINRNHPRHLFGSLLVEYTILKDNHDFRLAVHEAHYFIDELVEGYREEVKEQLLSLKRTPSEEKNYMLLDAHQITYVSRGYRTVYELKGGYTIECIGGSI